MTTINNNIVNVVSGANLREEFEITALFHIPKKYPCSYAFAQMEQAKKELLIDDYSITQTSLEQVCTTTTVSGILFRSRQYYQFLQFYVGLYTSIVCPLRYHHRGNDCLV